MGSAHPTSCGAYIVGDRAPTLPSRLCAWPAQPAQWVAKRGFSGNRTGQKIRVEARSLFCYWAVRELGYGLSELGRRLSMSQPGVGYAVSRGERIAKQNNYQLLDRVTYLLIGCPYWHPFLLAPALSERPQWPLKRFFCSPQLTHDNGNNYN